MTQIQEFLQSSQVAPEFINGTHAYAVESDIIDAKIRFANLLSQIPLEWCLGHDNKKNFENSHLFLDCTIVRALDERVPLLQERPPMLCISILFDLQTQKSIVSLSALFLKVEKVGLPLIALAHCWCKTKDSLKNSD